MKMQLLSRPDEFNSVTGNWNHCSLNAVIFTEYFKHSLNDRIKVLWHLEIFTQQIEQLTEPTILVFNQLIGISRDLEQVGFFKSYTLPLSLSHANFTPQDKVTAKIFSKVHCWSVVCLCSRLLVSTYEVPTAHPKAELT